MNRLRPNLPISALFLLMIVSCSPLRKVGKNESLLVKKKVIQEGPYQVRDDIKDFVLTKPNKKLLGLISLRLQIYNLINTEKMYRRRAYLDSMREAKNSARLADGKKPNIKQRNTITERFFQFGEAPVLFSEEDNKRTVENLENFLFNNGYFRGTVRDSTIISKNRKARVFYIVNRQAPYLIREMAMEIPENPSLKSSLKDWKEQSLLQEGIPFNLNKLDEERDRITRFLRKKGFYFFSKEHIDFEADTGLTNNEMKLTLRISEPDFNVKAGDSLIPIKRHRPAEIRNIIIDADYNPANTAPYTDTIRYDGFLFPYRGKMKMKPQVIAKQIILESGNYYNTDDNDFSYRNLSNLRGFRNISIEFVFVGNNKARDFLDCRIMLAPAQKQSIGVDFQGTTTGAYPGLESNFSYRNRNAFQGSEIFEFKVYGRAESQRVGGADVPFSIQSLFNTLEVGNEISIRTPKFLVPFRVFRYSKRNTPFTTIRVNNAYQTRPDYSRFISTFSFGYEWQETDKKFHRFIPLEFSAIRVQKTAAFQEIINSSNDLFLRNSFSDQILFHNLYSYNYSNYTAGKKGNYLAFRGNIQLGGNLLFLAGLAGAFPKDQSGRFTILNTPFAQFVRLEPDFRSYFVFSEKHSFALRGLLGVGVPYLNSKSLPFEKSFSAGGATDIRGWRARRLGPGSFNQNSGFAFDQFADLKLLLQAEYRFTVIKQIELALFADAGNIWAMNPDANRPLAHFDVRRFYREIALGAGLGLRLNLGFFIFRVDPGIPIYDPTVGPDQNRWVLPYIKWKSVVWNFAINYPF